MFEQRAVLSNAVERNSSGIAAVPTIATGYRTANFRHRCSAGMLNVLPFSSYSGICSSIKAGTGMVETK
jgi:hypothetical protein